MVRLGVFLLSMAGAASTLAAPAPWYQWRSLSGGSEACAQTSPGDGWQRVAGPFIDSGCKRRLRIVPL